MRERLIFSLLAGILLSFPAHAATTPEKKSKSVDLSNEKVLYLVGYAHLDTQWRWSYPQVIREFLASTLHDNFRLMDAHPDYIFNFSGSRRYEMMEEYYPAEFAKLKKYVASGQWFPCGSSVDEGDSIVPSLESMVRHVLYGNRYSEREFGTVSSEFMLPDCFGFPASLPSVLAHCGIKGFSTQKLTWGSASGIPFKVGNWIGPDGKSVVAALDPGSYVGTIREDLSANAGWRRRIENTGQKSGAYADYHYYGVGDRGGAPDEKSVRWVERSLKGAGPLRVVSANAQQMFDDLRPDQIAKLPSYRGELLLTNHSAGSITSQAYMKRWNRKNELLADTAERASVAALWLGAAPYPAKKLYDAWDLFLGSQMHDMLPGTSIPKAYEYCWNDELLALNQFGAITTDAAGAIASAMDTQTQGVPLIVFNPLSTARDDVVEAAVKFAGEAPEQVQVFDFEGREVPAQVDRRDGNTAHIVFCAHLPPTAFATFEVRPAAAGAGPGELRVTEDALENARYRVKLDAEGDVSSIFDKMYKRELLAGPARLALLTEKPERFPAWNMDWADRQKPPRSFVGGTVNARIGESGKARVTLEIERETEGSRFVQQIRLAAGPAGDRVEFVNKIDWRTPSSSLKATFPFAVANRLASYDDKLGVLERGNNNPKKFEVPQHQWCDLTDADGSYGVALLNDSKFGSDKPDDRTLRLTLLYTPGVRGDYQDQSSQDFGRHDITYAVAGHPGDWRKGNVTLQGRRLNQPLRAFQTRSHPGGLGRRFSLCAVDNAQVEVCAIKKAEASDEIVVRLREITGAPAAGLRVTMVAPIDAAREIDGQEKEVGPATIEQGKLVTDLIPFGLRAFALKLGSKPAFKVAMPVSQAVSLPYDLDAVSPDGNLKDGSFDAEGRSYPAEQFPRSVLSEGIEFTMGPVAAGEKNAVACRSQSIDLPAGDFNRVYILAAAASGNPKGDFRIGDSIVSQSVHDWTGYVGQWDNRLWEGEVPELAYVWSNDLAGLAPGYVASDTVAWYCSHRHHPEAGSEFYQYCYLFKYGFDIPKGAKTLTLPADDRIRVFAVSVAQTNHDEIVPAAPLSDTLEDHRPDSPPSASPASGEYHDTILVSLTPPRLYHAEGGIRYTTDGSEPRPDSSVYKEQLVLNKDATVKAREFEGDGTPSPVMTAEYRVSDHTPPTVLNILASSVTPEAFVVFSEPVDKASAETAAHYMLSPAMAVQSATLGADRKSVALALAQPLPAEGNARLAVRGVKDTSPAANESGVAAAPVHVAKPVFREASITCAGKTFEARAPELPVKAGMPWTINFFVKTDVQPANRTPIAGFGRAEDDRDGDGRYLAKFANGIHFWSRDRDVETTTPLDLNEWQMLTATYDGRILSIFKNAGKIGDAAIDLADEEPMVRIAPLDPWDYQRRFRGEIREFTIWREALSPGVLQALKNLAPVETSQ